MKKPRPRRPPPTSAGHPSARGGREHTRSAGPFRRRIVLALALAAALLIAGGMVYRSTRTEVAAGGARQNILLITLDTARADHFGAYGFTRARTRYLDRLAAEGVRFEWAFSPAPITLTGHASIFTGLYPFEHGVRNNGNFYLRRVDPTLATVLAKHGYRTGAFVSAFVLDRRYGLARGFDVYDDRMRDAQTQVVSLEAERRGDYTSLALSAWLDSYARARSIRRPARRCRRPRGCRAILCMAAPVRSARALSCPRSRSATRSPIRPTTARSPSTDAIVASVLDKLRQLGAAREHDRRGDWRSRREPRRSWRRDAFDVRLRCRGSRATSAVEAGTPSSRDRLGEPVRITDLPPTLLDLVGAPALPAPHARTLLPVLNGARSTDVPRRSTRRRICRSST